MNDRNPSEAGSEFDRIVTGMLRGERWASEAFVRKYTIPFIRHLISRWNCSNETAEDLTNDTVAEIIEQLRREAKKGPVKEKRTAWGYKILANKACDHIAEKMKNQAQSLDAMAEDAGSIPDKRERTASAKVILKESQQERLRARLFWEEEYAKIAGETRKLLDLVRGGLSVAEIAKKTGKNYHTCHTLIKRAQDRLGSIVDARLKGVPPPEPVVVVPATLTAAIRRLTADRRDLARMVCLDRLSVEAIAEKTGRSRDSIESDLGLVWIDLSNIFHTDFPEALNSAEK